MHNHDGTALGVTLDPEKAVRVEATFTSRRGRSATVRRNLRWTPTVVCPDPEQTVIIRAGDSLLLTAARANRNTPLAVDLHDDGTAEYLGTHRLAVRFAEPGTYPLALLQAGPNERVQANIQMLQQLIQQYRRFPWIRAILQDILRAYQREATTRPENLVATEARLGMMTVRVIGVDLDGPIACEVGYRREKGVAVFPLGEADTPVFESADAQMLEVDVIPDDQLSAAVLANPQYNPANYGKRLYLLPTRRGMPMLLGRLPADYSGAEITDRSGNLIPTPLLAYQEIDEFTRQSSATNGICINPDTQVGQARFIIRPYVPGLVFAFDMFSSKSTFAGGETYKEVQSESFESMWDDDTQETVGVYTLDIEIPGSETSYCMRLTASQESKYGSPISKPIANNGDPYYIKIVEVETLDGKQTVEKGEDGANDNIVRLPFRRDDNKFTVKVLAWGEGKEAKVIPFSDVKFEINPKEGMEGNAGITSINNEEPKESYSGSTPQTYTSSVKDFR